MYLSKLVLNARIAVVRRELANPYELHRTLSGCMNGPSAGRLLWRLEQARGQIPTVLAQTPMAPDWSFLAEREPGYCAEPPCTKAYNPRLAEGMILAFRLRANPVVKRAGKRHGINTCEEQALWLQKRGEKGGFRVLAATSLDERLIEARKPGHRIQLAAVTYDGQLAVTDIERFRSSLNHGIGPAKGLGFGLLSIAPVRT